VFIILRHPPFKVWPVGQSICFIEDTRSMQDGEVILQEKEGPTGLLMRVFLFGAKVGEVVMISPHLEGI